MQGSIMEETDQSVKDVRPGKPGKLWVYDRKATRSGIGSRLHSPSGTPPPKNS